MQTYSHTLLTIWLRNRIGTRWSGDYPHWVMVAGSFVPDLPLILLTLWYFARQRAIYGEDAPLFGPDYDYFYFQDYFWLTSHNMFHGPLAVLLWLGLGYYFGMKRGSRGWTNFFWFAVGCAFHSVTDIVTHHDDGPLLWFPFDWKTRFMSPISYWDPRYYAFYVSRVEHVLDLAVVLWLAARGWHWLRKRRSDAAVR